MAKSTRAADPERRQGSPAAVCGAALGPPACWPHGPGHLPRHVRQAAHRNWTQLSCCPGPPRWASAGRHTHRSRNPCPRAAHTTPRRRVALPGNVGQGLTLEGPPYSAARAGDCSAGGGGALGKGLPRGGGRGSLGCEQVVPAPGPSEPHSLSVALVAKRETQQEAREQAWHRALSAELPRRSVLVKPTCISQIPDSCPGANHSGGLCPSCRGLPALGAVCAAPSSPAFPQQTLWPRPS